MAKDVDSEHFRLDQHPFQIQRAQQLLKNDTFTGFAGVAGCLGTGEVKEVRADRHMVHKPQTAILSQS